VFSPLDASRPTVASERVKKVEQKRPGWMPPPRAFPVIWITIGVLRTISSSLIYTHTGSLLSKPLLAIMLHLSIGTRP
jgi:tryptophan-rich sensory protein